MFFFIEESLPELSFIYVQSGFVIQCYANSDRRLVGWVIKIAAPTIIESFVCYQVTCDLAHSGADKKLIMRKAGGAPGISVVDVRPNIIEVVFPLRNSSKRCPPLPSL